MPLIRHPFVNKKDMLNDFRYTLVESEDNIYYLEYKDRYYKIGIHTNQLLRMLEQGYGIGEIALKMNVTKSDLEEALNKINVVIAAKKDNRKIKSILILLNSRICNCIGRLLSFLFEKNWVETVSLIAVLVNIIFYLKYAHFSLLFIDITVFHYLMFLLIIMFLHEIGHVCAAYTYGLKGLNVRLGLFFVWPVCYVDLNKQILLSPSKRIRISFGGIYFQLIFSVLIMIYFYCTQDSSLLLLLNMNNFIIIMNLMPVLVLDGYWIFSDIICVDNLNKKSSDLIVKSVKNIRYLRLAPLKLSIYAVARLFTICLIVLYVIKLLFYRLQFSLDIWYLLHEDISFILIVRVIWWLFPIILLLIYIVKKAYGKN